MALKVFCTLVLENSKILATFAVLLAMYVLPPKTNRDKGRQCHDYRQTLWIQCENEDLKSGFSLTQKQKIYNYVYFGSAYFVSF
jgi:hypothetical protein